MNVKKQIASKEYVVEGIRFSVTPFSAYDSAGILGDILQFIAPAIGSVGKSVLQSQSDKLNDMLNEISVDDVAGKLSTLNGTNVQKLIKELLMDKGNVYYHDPDAEGDIFTRLNMESFNEIFCQDIFSAFVLCGHVIMLNFGGFFTKLGTRRGKAVVQKNSPTTINTESSTFTGSEATLS